MPYLEAPEVLKRVLEGSVTASEGLVSLVDRSNGTLALPEGLHLDYKAQIDHSSLSAIGECSRDILGFSNAEGGAIVIGFDDSGRFRWPANMDIHRLHDQLGPFIGTRVTYEIGGLELQIGGRQFSAGYIRAPRNEASYPHLLRKDIVQDSGFSRKTKYVRGSLFYRVNASVLTESPYGDIDGVARELRFTGVGPRTTTSFQIVGDRPLLRMYSPINNRFFGRDREVNTMIGEFDNIRGRGISIGGFGGMGKTELAIHIVSRLHQHGRFKAIYSGSAKQTVLGSTGPQQADPVFIDLRSFLIDLSGWLGLNTSPSADIESLKVSCISGLKNHEAKEY
ncbi:MAG: hypothetical protein JWQ49_6695 [Edaphobacter sp.]|nr:hypothetical protein [Edaphobacter sp.]